MASLSFFKIPAVLLAGVLLAPAVQAQNVTPDADRPGHDIARIADAGMDGQQCIARCEAHAQCAAWVLVKDGSQGGVNVCYLKNTVASAHPNRCCDTGVKAGRPISPANAPSLSQKPLKGGSGGGPNPGALPATPVPKGGETSSDWRPPPVIP